MELFKAYRQWAERPADERFWSLADMAAACRAYRDSAVTSTVYYRDLRVEAAGQDVQLVGRTGVPAQLTHYAFGQLAGRTKSPAGYLRQLPPTLAAQCLNHGLKERAADDTAKLLFHKNGHMLLRAAVSEKYERLWNHEIADRLLDVLPEGWRPPPARPTGNGDVRARPATEADVLNRRGMLSVNVGDMIAPAGIYASDRDMFVFLVNEEQTVDDGTDEGMARGVMLWNSEVGDKSFGGRSFLYKAVCGNHIVWDAKDVTEFRFRHVGDVRNRAWGQLQADITEYEDSSVSDIEAKIRCARTYEIAGTKVDVVDALLGFSRKRKLQLNAGLLGRAYDRADEHQDWYGVTPNTAWGMTQGLTELSQEAVHTDVRTKLDRAAGKVMEIAF